MTAAELELGLRAIEAEFLPYQIKLIYDTKKKFLAVEKAVRTGITYAHSYKSSKKRMFRGDKPRIREIFSSKTRTIASEYMGYHRRWAECWNALFGETRVDLSTWTSELARYPGGDILIVSSDPDAFRGLEGDVTLDEFAFHDQQQALFSAAQSRVQWLTDGQVSLISSHSHPETVFASIVSEIKGGKRSNFSLHAVPLAAAVEQGLAYKVPGKHQEHRNGTPNGEQRCREWFIRSIKASCLSEEDYLREYCCQPAALSALVDGDVYDNGVLEKVPDTLDASIVWGDLFVGIDCGRSHDLTVAWVLQRGYDRNGVACYRTVCVKAIRNQPFPIQHQILLPILTNGYIAKGFIDQGAQGRALADSVADETGSVIEPLGMGSQNKAVMAERLRAFAQSNRISFPDDPDVRASMLSIRKEVTPSKNLKYEGGTGTDHGDYFWAAALALHSAEYERNGARLYLPEPAAQQAAAA